MIAITEKQVLTFREAGDAHLASHSDPEVARWHDCCYLAAIATLPALAAAEPPPRCPGCLHEPHQSIRCGWGAGDPEGFMGCECLGIFK